jgi:hypothetical protein
MRTWSLMVLLSLLVGLLIFSGSSVVFADTAWNLAGGNLGATNMKGGNLGAANMRGGNGVQVNVDGFAKSTGFVFDGFKVVGGRLIVGQ